MPDTLLFESPISKPKAATVSYGLLHGILSGEQLGLKPYENAIATALAYDKCAVLSGDARVSCELDKALANVGAMFATQVEGRVCTEVDPRLANNQAAMVEQVHKLIGLYAEMSVPTSKLIFRIPATWEGIQAAAALEKEGIATQVFMVYSLVQGVAAAQAGVSVVQPNVGRVRDWYNRHPGVIRDPKGPREDSGFSSRSDPGVGLVKELYAYIKKYHPKTQIMASGLRTKEDALNLSGCDYLIVNSKIISALAAAPTMAGYNDGLSAGDSVSESVERQLSPQAAAASDVPQVGPLSQQVFQEQLSIAATDLLKVGLKGLHSDISAVIPFMTRRSMGTD